MKHATRNSLFLAGAVVAAAAVSWGQTVPEQVLACRSLQEPAQVRACLQDLRGRQAPEDRPQRGGDNALLRFLIAEYLELTPEQRDAAKTVRQSFQETMKPYREQIVQGFRDMRDAAKNGQSVDFLAEEQGRLIGEALKAVFAQRADARAAVGLTPEQEEKLDRIIEAAADGRPEIPGIGGGIGARRGGPRF